MILARTLLCAAVAACTAEHGPIMIELGTNDAAVTRTFDVDGERTLTLVTQAELVVEAWIAGGELAAVPDAQREAGAPSSWLAPTALAGTRDVTITGNGEVTVSAWSRGAVPPAATRERSATWFDAALLDDAQTISFARVMAAIADDGHGGILLDRWFRAFAAGPGAGRATFQQFLGEVAIAQGSDPAAWDLAALPFRVTGVHNRIDLGRGDDCGELRVSIASTHSTFSPVHLIFLFRQPLLPDDATPDGTGHCRGTARRWAHLAALDEPAFVSAARDVLAASLARERFLAVESVELTLSPWQWRQWVPDGSSGLANPPLFQTIDVTRVNTAGATRDAFLAAVAANADAIAARTWTVPAQFRASVAEVQPNAKATLVDLTPLTDTLGQYPGLPLELGMIGCPRCHTDDADFVQTAIDRTPSPFYDRELDARSARIDALAHDGWPALPTFGPLSPP